MFAAYATSGPSGSGDGSIKKEPGQADQTEQKGLNEQTTGKYSSFVGAAASQNVGIFYLKICYSLEFFVFNLI